MVRRGAHSIGRGAARRGRRGIRDPMHAPPPRSVAPRPPTPPASPAHRRSAAARRSTAAACAARDATLRRPGRVAAFEEGRHHRHRAAGHQHADARLERRHRAVPRPRPLGEQDVDEPVLDQPFAQRRQFPRLGPLAPDRQRIHRIGREGRGQRRAEEGIPRRQRMGPPRRLPAQHARQRQRIEMAGVVGDQHEGRFRQVLPPRHRQPVERREIPAQPRAPTLPSTTGCPGRVRATGCAAGRRSQAHGRARGAA